MRSRTLEFKASVSTVEKCQHAQHSSLPLQITEPAFILSTFAGVDGSQARACQLPQEPPSLRGAHLPEDLHGAHPPEDLRPPQAETNPGSHLPKTWPPT